jgi:predicted nucleotide-binding protein
MPARRPSVFIGSSREGLTVAQAIQVNLDRACEMVLWSQGVFGLGGGTLETLVNKTREFDFAILAITPDDMVESRGEAQATARDNVLIEIGLFIGSLGRERTFVVFDRSANIKIPSDLGGITLADFEPHSNGNMQAALGAACTKISDAITRLGLFVPPGNSSAMDRNAEFQNISNLLDVPSRQLLILMQEQNVRLPNDISPINPAVFYDFRSADGSSGTGGYLMKTLCAKLADAEIIQQDLRDRIGLTDRGREFARWLTEHGRRVNFFQTNAGGWGELEEGQPDMVTQMLEQARVRTEGMRADTMARAAVWRGQSIVSPPVDSSPESEQS